MSHTSFIPTLLILVVAPFVAAAQSAPRDLPLARIDSLVGVEYAKDSLGSVTVGVVAGGRLVWAKSYGYANREQGVLATPATVYRIASVTKQFTALMLLQLVERGRLRLSDRVETFLPEIRRLRHRAPVGAPITFVQLATMTAGLEGEPTDAERYNVGPPRVWEQRLLASLPGTAVLWEPGSRFNYSNTSYAVLAAALSRAAGEPYVGYVERHILAPLGMGQTGFVPDARMSTALAKGYHLEGRTLDTLTPLREHAGRGKNLPAGGLYSTVGDLARFVAFELGYGPPGVLRRATLDSVFAGIVAADADLNYGEGIGFSALRRLPSAFVALGHMGQLTGYRSAVLFHRASHTGVIVLTSATRATGPTPKGADFQEVAQEILPLLVEPTQEEVSAPPKAP